MHEITQTNIIEWNSDDIRSLKRSMLDQKKLPGLTKKTASTWAILVAIDLLIICTAALVAELYFSVPLYIIVIMAIAARQVGIGTIALHDGAHGFLAKDKKTNQLAGSIMLVSLTVPILGIDSNGYQKDGHFRHHRYLLTKKDPENHFVIEAHNKSKWTTRRDFLLLILFTLSGFAYVLTLLRQVIFSKWVYKCGATLVIAGCVLALIFDIYLLKLFLFYWIIPLATWGLFINYVRGLAEHYPINVHGDNFPLPQHLRTRDIVPSGFDKIFVATRNVNLHLSHHLFPSVPFYNLEKLHKEISTSDRYKMFCHQTNGYHHFLYEYLFLRFRE